MSRTIRRKKCYSYQGMVERDFTHEDAKGWEDCRGYPVAPQVRKTGKAFLQGWWNYHSDAFQLHPSEYLHSWGSVRTKNKTDLARWYRNPHHDCIFIEGLRRKYIY